VANSSILCFNGFSSCDTRSYDERSPHRFESALGTTESRRSSIPLPLIPPLEISRSSC
ncbi:unnamed protein product, partial [Brassica napus]